MRKKINKFGLVNLSIIGISLIINLIHVIQLIVYSRFTGLQVLSQTMYLVGVFLFIEYLHELRTTKKENQ